MPYNVALYSSVFKVLAYRHKLDWRGTLESRHLNSINASNMPKALNKLVLTYLQTYFSDAEISKVTSIQTLWSGYGEIARYLVPSLNKTVVIKVVDPQSESVHPRGWDGQRSHQRKLDSYVNEAVFYSRYSSETDALCRVPMCYTASSGVTNFAGGDSAESNSVESVSIETAELGMSQKPAAFNQVAKEDNNPMSLLIMEDLDHAGYSARCDKPSISKVMLGIRWLAYFHAKHMNQALNDLWPVGTYWHLATRPDELAKMPKSKLKLSAGIVDNCLNNASFQTLLHGDAKLANFCFTTNGDDLAAVDFQYVGRGAGVKDLMYFLGSCLDDEALFTHSDTLLTAYFSHLKQAIEKYQVTIDVVKLEAEWRYLYPFAWADFQRFLIGWATEHYKLNRFMNEQTKIALSQC